MDNNLEHARPMNSKEFDAVGLPETARVARKTEKQNSRRKLAQILVGAGIATGLLGAYAAASDSDYHQAMKEQEKNQTGPALIDKTNLNSESLEINIPPTEQRP